TQGQAAELIFAEYLSAFGQDAVPLIAEVELNESPAATEDHSAPIEAPVLRPARPIENMEPDSSIGEIEDTWLLADALIDIARQKQQLRFELAGRLREFADQAGARALGYAGFERYCCDRLGFSLRRAERLIRFRAGLDRFPKLRAAFLAGHISYTAVLLLLPVIHRATEAVWVTWAKDLAYREVERVTEYARTFALPDANPKVLEAWVKGLEEQGLAKRLVGAVAEATAFVADPAATAEATAFVADPAPVPLGCALPPVTNRGLPRIVGISEDLALTPPEHCVARIRFWLPQDALDLAQRALHRCRISLKDPLTPSWSVFEIILVHFIQTHETPQSRKFDREHAIIARDGYWCLSPGCMCRSMLEDHHMVLRSDCGSNMEWNRGTLCFGQHRRGVHRGAMRMFGFAPDHLVFMLGIHPKTGKPFVCYRNERRISTEEAYRYLDEWRQALREGAVPMALSAN
ncbi:MAG TPA: hypothetical protein VNL97_04335, partial [Solirubrobacterales bacterium]|nr:hypothetical protein [Solirubrobacterales bacterium]